MSQSSQAPAVEKKRVSFDTTATVEKESGSFDTTATVELESGSFDTTPTVELDSGSFDAPVLPTDACFQTPFPPPDWPWPVDHIKEPQVKCTLCDLCMPKRHWEGHVTFDKHTKRKAKLAQQQAALFEKARRKRENEKFQHTREDVSSGPEFDGSMRPRSAT